METIEITAPSLDQAKEQAASQLGVDAGQVAVTVIEETKGLFGKSQVRVRAHVEAKPEKKTRTTKAKAEPAPKAEEPQPEPEAKPAKAPRVTKAKARPAKAEDGDTAAAVEVVATKKDAQQVTSILEDLLGSSGLEVSVRSSEVTGKYVNVSIEGDDASYLVGRRGEVLNALQYLMNVIVARQMDNGVRVVVDGDHYRERRTEVLEKLATDIATEVKKRGEEAVLDALPAFERRIIHQVLSEIDGVVTYSEGEEPDRRVVIAPAEVA